MKKWIVILVILVVGFGAYSYFSIYKEKQILVDADFIEGGEYLCFDGKNIGVANSDKIIRLSLSDKRVFTLEQVSIDDENGTKFANDKDEVVFWVKDDGAYLIENGTTTYMGCRVVSY